MLFESIRYSVRTSSIKIRQPTIHAEEGNSKGEALVAQYEEK